MDSSLPGALKYAKMSGKLGDPLHDTLVSSADGITGTRRSPGWFSRGSSLAVITTPDGGLSLALISLICAISMV
jgi:hypothetical protein